MREKSCRAVSVPARTIVKPAQSGTLAFMFTLRFWLLALSCGMVADSAATGIILPPRPVIVDQVWSGHPVDFALVDGRRHYFIAYYDAQRRMTVASLPVGGSTFTYQKLDSVTGWDSHNYIAMAEDGDGHLHVIGNLHNDPLVYFRTSRPGDVTSLERVTALVDPARERRMTYPVFIQRRDRSLVLKYRDGGSGNGNEIYVAYDARTRRWRSLLDTPLVDGEGRRNAYFVGPTTGPDGRFHLTWVWRDTPDAETNHDLSYARSADLVHWEKSDGTPLRLPITLAAAEIVDPVPVRGGMINNNTVVGFDNAGLPVITYHKFDARGNTQVFLARREKRGWRSVQLTDWRDFRWDFGGRGSLASRLEVGRLLPAPAPWQELYIVRDGRTYQLRVRSRDLKLLRETPFTTRADAFAHSLRLPAGMVWNTVSADNSLALIAWPTLPRNRDLPRAEVPPPTPLVLGLPGASHDPR
jgi:hypothetical protein